MASPLDLALDLAGHAGRAGIDHGFWRARQKRLPSLDQALARRGLTLDLNEAIARANGIRPAAMPGQIASGQVPAGPANPTLSYADEFGGLGYDDTSPDTGRRAVACWNCTVRHANTIVAALEEGAASSDPRAWREAAVTARGEIEVWLRYDVTEEKLAATSPGRREPIVRIVPRMNEAAESLPAPPHRMHLAWAAAGEAERFAGSNGGNPSPLEEDERDKRLRDVQGWVGLADTRGRTRQDVRAARQRLNSDGPAPETVLQMKEALWAAAVETCPQPTHEQIQQALSLAKRAREDFYSGAFEAVRGERREKRMKSETLGRPLPRNAYVDLDRGIPEALAHAYLDEVPVSSIPETLGATPDTRQAFARLAKFSRANRVPVLDESLPAEYELEGGQVEPVGIIEGAYLPTPGGKHDEVMVGTQSPVAAPKDVAMLLEEVAHSLLDNDRCNIWKSFGKGIPYLDMPEEREAKLAAMMAAVKAGLPFETQEGRRIDPRRIRLDIEEIERKEDPRIVARARWAAGVEDLVLAGDQAQALAIVKSGCPRP